MSKNTNEGRTNDTTEDASVLQQVEGASEVPSDNEEKYLGEVVVDEASANESPADSQREKGRQQMTKKRIVVKKESTMEDTNVLQPGEGASEALSHEEEEYLCADCRQREMAEQLLESIADEATKYAYRQLAATGLVEFVLANGNPVEASFDEETFEALYLWHVLGFTNRLMEELEAQLMYARQGLEKESLWRELSPFSGFPEGCETFEDLLQATGFYQDSVE